MRVVVALGGNALLRRGEPLTVEAMTRNIAVAAEAVAAVAREHDVIITHGNGPQIGMLALQSEADHDISPQPLDVLGAESEGMIGYLLERALRNEMPDREIVTLLSQVLVDPADPAFDDPTKPIGPVYDRRTAEKLASERGWSMAADGDGLRRVVASPRPQHILGLRAIERLLDQGVLAICVGGGGVPVFKDEANRLRGIEAVIDKDRAASVLSLEMGAEVLLLLTDVEGIWPEWPPDGNSPLQTVSSKDLACLSLDPGSMGPKAEAACAFIKGGGLFAGIGALEDAVGILAGDVGTRVVG